MNRDQIVAYVADHAEASEQSELFWLTQPGTNYQFEDDYCEDCIGIIAALPTLVFCHLNLLRGESVPPGVHRFTRDDGSPSHTCEVCEEWEGYPDLKCWDAPRQAIEWNKAAIDGGWSGESDGWRYCANCDKSLRVNLTDYGVEEELRHWKHYGPPSCGADWWQFSEALERLTKGDKHWKTIEELFTKWGLS